MRKVDPGGSLPGFLATIASMTALTTTRRRMPALGALLATLALGSLGACVSPQQDDPHDSTGYLPGTGLDAVQPADIAVMPVELRLLDPSGAEGIPVDDAIFCL